MWLRHNGNSSQIYIYKSYLPGFGQITRRNKLDLLLQLEKLIGKEVAEDRAQRRSTVVYCGSDKQLLVNSNILQRWRDVEKARPRQLARSLMTANKTIIMPIFFIELFGGCKDAIFTEE